MNDITLIEVAKDESEGIKTYDVVQTFRNSDNLEEVKNAVRVAKERLFVAWASVDVKDKDGEIINIQDIINQQDKFLERGGTIIDNHSNAPIGKVIAYKTDMNQLAKKQGVLYLCKIFNDNDRDNMVWAEITEGKRTGLSIGGRALSQEIEYKDGDVVRTMNDFFQYEVSSVYNPANQFALTEAASAVAKSADDIKTIEHDVTLNGDTYHVKSTWIKSSSTSEKSESKSEEVKSDDDEHKSNEEKQMVEETKKGDILDTALAKAKSGEEMSEDEQKALQTAVEIARAKEDEPVEEEKMNDEEEMEAEEDEEKSNATKSEAEVKPEGGPSDGPEPEQNNDDSVFKAELQKRDKQIAELTKSMKKLQSRKTVASPKANTNVTKSQKPSINAVDIAKCATKMSWSQLHGLNKRG